MLNCSLSSRNIKYPPQMLLSLILKRPNYLNKRTSRTISGLFNEVKCSLSGTETLYCHLFLQTAAAFYSNDFSFVTFPKIIFIEPITSYASKRPNFVSNL